MSFPTNFGAALHTLITAFSITHSTSTPTIRSRQPFPSGSDQDIFVVSIDGSNQAGVHHHSNPVNAILHRFREFVRLCSEWCSDQPPHFIFVVVSQHSQVERWFCDNILSDPNLQYTSWEWYFIGPPRGPAGHVAGYYEDQLVSDVAHIAVKMSILNNPFQRNWVRVCIMTADGNSTPGSNATPCPAIGANTSGLPQCPAVPFPDLFGMVNGHYRELQLRRGCESPDDIIFHYSITDQLHHRLVAGRDGSLPTFEFTVTRLRDSGGGPMRGIISDSSTVSGASGVSHFSFTTPPPGATAQSSATTMHPPPFLSVDSMDI